MALHRHHRRALKVITLAAALDVALGLAFAAASHIGPAEGLYFATVTATTVGYGDITPHGWLPHLLAAGIMLTVIPLFASAFSLMTSGLTAEHTAEAERNIRAHLEEQLAAHHDKIRKLYLGDRPGKD